MSYEKAPVSPRMLSSSIRRSQRTILLLIVLCTILISIHIWESIATPPPPPPLPVGDLMFPGFPPPPPEQPLAFGFPPPPKPLVPFEAHIMSKCPDAQDCLRDMVLPAMQKIHDKVNFTLSFVGRPTDSGGVSCRHGPEECMGNILELCAFELYPDPKISLGFTMCLTRDYKAIPGRELVEACALEHAIDIKKLNECASNDNGAHGAELLVASVQRTISANVTKSCTVRVNNAIYCVRDDGDWKNCPKGPGVEKLISSIEKLYGS